MSCVICRTFEGSGRAREELVRQTLGRRHRVEDFVESSEDVLVVAQQRLKNAKKNMIYAPADSG